MVNVILGHHKYFVLLLAYFPYRMIYFITVETLQEHIWKISSNLNKKVIKVIIMKRQREKCLLFLVKF